VEQGSLADVILNSEQDIKSSKYGEDIEQMVNRVMELPERTKIQILAPIVKGKKGEHKKVFENIQKDGYIRIRVDGEMMETTDEISLEKT